MGTPTRDANDEAGLVPVIIPEEKSVQTGKREAEEPLVKATSVKKPKVQAYVEKVNAAPPEEESTSTEEDTYTESEEEENVASKVRGKEGNNEEEVNSSDKTKIQSTSETPIGNQNKRGAITINVANLPSKIDEDDVAAFFKEAGEVTEVRLAIFGHVKFATEEAAKKALEMNQREFMGRELKLELAKQKVSSTPYDREQNSSNPKGEDKPKALVGNQNECGSRTIFVGNLPCGADKADIAYFFKEAGRVIHVRLDRNEDDRPKGFCHVDFATEEAAKKALEMNNEEFSGSKLIIDLAYPKVFTHRREYNSSIPNVEEKGKGTVMIEDTPPGCKPKSNNKEPHIPVGNKNERGLNMVFVGNLSYDADEDDMKHNSSNPKGEDKGTDVVMEDAPSGGKPKSKKKEPKTPAGNQNERGSTMVFVGNLPYCANEDDMKHNSSNPKVRDKGTDVVIDDASSGGKLKPKKKKPKTLFGNQNEHGLTTVFVGNLPFRASKDDIASFFKEAGEVTEVRLARSEDDRPKGFCHVKFATEEAAKKALEMNQKEFMGREVRLELSKERFISTPKNRKHNSSNPKVQDKGTDVVMDDAPSGGKPKSKNKEPNTRVGNQSERGLNTVFVGNLPYGADEDAIASFFEKAGEVIDVRLPRSEHDRSRMFCHVDFAAEEAVKKALEMNKKEFSGRKVTIELALPKASTHNREDDSSNCKGEKRGGHRVSHSGHGAKRRHVRTHN